MQYINFDDPYHPEMNFRRSFRREEDALYNETPAVDYSIPRPPGYWQQYDRRLAALREQYSTANVVMLQNGKFTVRRITLAGGLDYSDERADRIAALDSATAQWGV